MSKTTQRECVFNAVSMVVGQIEGAVVLTKEQNREVCDLVAAALHAGEADLSESARAKYPTQEDLRKKYVPGLVNNWLRKDKMLNGGVAYVAKNPGSRAGSGDELLKSLKQLKATLTEASDIALVDQEIAARQATIAAEAAAKKQTTINIDILPDHLRSLLAS